MNKRHSPQVMNITLVLAIARKEFQHIMRDPLSLIAVMGLPLFLLIMFGYATSLDIKNIPISVHDLDASRQSRELVQKLISSNYFVLEQSTHTANNGDKSLDTGVATVILEIPRGFATDLDNHRPTNVLLLVDGSDSTRAQTIIAYLEGVIRQYGQSQIPAGARVQVGLDVRSHIMFNQELRSVLFLIPGLVALIMIITAVVSSAMAIVREKERGSLEQILVSPIRAQEFLIGKLIPYGVLSSIVAIIIIVTAVFLFNVPIKGSIIELALTSLLFIFACLLMGLFISTVAATQQIAFLIATFTTLLPTYILSGFIFPLRNMPLIIQVIAHIFPTLYYIDITSTIMTKGGGFLAYWKDVLALGIFSLVILAISMARFNHQKVHIAKVEDPHYKETPNSNNIHSPETAEKNNLHSPGETQ